LGVIRASYSLVELPVIIVTAKDQSDDMVAALKVGANDYVTKPFNFPVLLARMSNQLQVKRSRQPAAPAPGGSPRRESPRPAAHAGFGAHEADTRHGAAAMATLVDSSASQHTRSGSSSDQLLGRRPSPAPAEPGQRPGSWGSLAVQTATVAGYEIISK